MVRVGRNASPDPLWELVAFENDLIVLAIGNLFDSLQKLHTLDGFSDNHAHTQPDFVRAMVVFVVLRACAAPRNVAE